MRYHRGSVEDSLRAAKTLSTKTGKTAYVEPTAYGLAVSVVRPASFQPYWKVDGQEHEYVMAYTSDPAEA